MHRMLNNKAACCIYLRHNNRRDILTLNCLLDTLIGLTYVGINLLVIFIISSSYCKKRVKEHKVKPTKIIQ